MQGVSGNQAPTGGDKTNESVRAMLARLFQDGNQEMQALADFCGIDIKCVEASIKAGEDTPLVRMLFGMLFGLFAAVMTRQMEQERRIGRIIARLASMDKGKEARHE